MIVAIIIAHTDLIMVAVVGMVYGIRSIIDRSKRHDRRKNRGV